MGIRTFTTSTFTSLFAAWKATADDTAGGQTLATLKGSALGTQLKRLILFADASGEEVTFGTGTVSGTSPALPGDVAPIVLDIDKTLADTIKLFSTAGGDVVVIELG